MIVVRKFVHLLDQSDQDFQEELDLMRMREEVITLIRSNQQLENDLNIMDIKIGLLVKNKITLQVWSSVSQGLGALSSLIPLPPAFMPCRAGLLLSECCTFSFMLYKK